MVQVWAHNSLSIIYTPALPQCIHVYVYVCTHTHTPGGHSLLLFTLLLKHLPGTVLLEDRRCLVPGCVCLMSREGKHGVTPALGAPLPVELHSSAHLSPACPSPSIAH